MSKRNLLLCFDAFGTLFHQKAPIEREYAEVARQCGLTLFSEDLIRIRSSFAAAFRAEAKKHPNYGRYMSLGATQWWTNVIHNTFAPLVSPPGAALPADLAPRLMRHFASTEGYVLAPGLPALIQFMRRPGESLPGKVYDRIVVGVITNSDDRVPVILASFGLQVSPLRYVEGCCSGEAHASDAHDINFHCMSYDVGCEKPDPRIFRAAESLLVHMLKSVADADADADAKADADVDGTMAKNDADASLVGAWDKMYVGDDFSKDVVGALNAGWYPVYLHSPEQQRWLHDSIPDLEDFATQPIRSLFSQHEVVKTRSLDTLAGWLTGCVGSAGSVGSAGEGQEASPPMQGSCGK